MNQMLRELKIALAKIEHVAERFNSAGFDAQAAELDEAAERIDGIITDIEMI